MPSDYESAVNDLRRSIRAYLQHQQDGPVTDDAVAAYIARTDPRACIRISWTARRGGCWSGISSAMQGPDPTLTRSYCEDWVHDRTATDQEPAQ